jgi:hypothetical protein
MHEHNLGKRPIEYIQIMHYHGVSQSYRLTDSERREVLRLNVKRGTHEMLVGLSEDDQLIVNDEKQHLDRDMKPLKQLNKKGSR